VFGLDHCRSSRQPADLRASFVIEALRSFGVTDSSISNLSSFIDIFEKWNLSINLSAATSRAEIETHVVDSLHVIPHLQGRREVLDVGAGGGFPGVVAAICLPTIRVTSLEPVHKKHAFLRTVARELRLSNFEPLTQRLEDHSKRDYDVAMSRATFDLLEWLTLGSSYVASGGVVIGFEAVPRTDLPPSTLRHSYALGDRQRSIVTLVRISSG